MIYLILGTLLGMLSLIPGFHPNLIFPLILAFVKDFNKLIKIAISLLISSNFFEFLKTTFFASPDEGDILNLSYIERLAKKGEVKKGLILQLLGGLIGGVISIILFPLTIEVVKYYYNIRKFITLALLIIPIYTAKKSKNFKYAIITYLISGIYGYFVLNFFKNSIGPLLTGLFGLSTLLKDKGKKVYFKKMKVKINKKKLFLSSFYGSLSAILLPLIPSLTPSQASLIGLSWLNLNEYTLCGIASVNVADVVYSVASLIKIGKGRSGVLEMAKKVGRVGNLDILIYLSLSILLSFLLSTYLSNFIMKKISNKERIKIFSIISMIVITLTFYKITGLAILILSALIGYLLSKKAERINLLGSLMMPTTIYFITK